MSKVREMPDRYGKPQCQEGEFVCHDCMNMVIQRRHSVPDTGISAIYNRPCYHFPQGNGDNLCERCAKIRKIQYEQKTKKEQRRIRVSAQEVTSRIQHRSM